MYQINRPRNSTKISDLRINRLSKWQVTLLQQGEVSLDPRATKVFQLAKQSLSCTLELDVNTVQDYEDIFECVDQHNVFLELVELSREIAEKGDAP